MKTTVKINCYNNRENMKKISIPVKKEFRNYYGIQSTVYEVNKQLSLAAKP